MSNMLKYLDSSVFHTCIKSKNRPSLPQTLKTCNANNDKTTRTVTSYLYLLLKTASLSRYRFGFIKFKA